MNTPATTPASKRWTRRAVLAFGFALLAFGGVALISRGGPTPVPPVIPLEGLDPDCASAIAHARQHVVDDPDSAEAWGFLGKVLLANGLNVEANVCLIRTEELDGKEPRWPYYRGIANYYADPQDAIACFRRAIECGDRHDPAATSPRLQLAGLLLQEGRDEEAEEMVASVRARQPDAPQTVYLTALLLANRNDLRGSIALMLRLTDDPGARQKASTKLAQFYLRLGDRASSRTWDEAARSLPEDAPWSDPYTSELAQLSVGRGQRFKEVTRLEKQQRYAEAVALLQKMIEKDEGSVSRAYVQLGNDLVHLARGPEAEEAYQNALRLTPDDVETHNCLALVRLFQGEERANRFGDREGAKGHYRRALESARNALRIDPRHVDAGMTLGQILLALGEREEGIAALRRCLRARPEFANAHLVLGKALAEDGRASEARTHLQDAIRFADKNDARPKQALERLDENRGKESVAP